MYIAAFDGGATKTHCIIGDDKGNVLGEGFGPGSNYQVIGVKYSKNSLQEALDNALKKAKLELKDISYASLGMSGADEAEDFIHINGFVKKVLGDVPFDVYHDSWIGLRASSEEYVGVVAICGTGTGYSGRKSDGTEVQLRNLTYETGNKGGGGDLLREALHYTFRSDEGTYKKTALEEELPKLVGAENIEELNIYLRKNSFWVEEEVAKEIPKLVFELASKGDEVCRELLRDMGETVGRYTVSVAKKLDLLDEEFPVILIGSIYKGKDPTFLDSMKETVLQKARNAKFVVPEKPPVYGAYYLAVDKYNK